MPSRLPKNIVLIGMRGTGKSAIGRTLAKYLGWQFIDIDKALEAGENLSIPELIKMHDWEYFRDLESKYTALAAGQKNAVIASGGGVILRPANTEALKKTGVIVLLQVPLHHMAKRVAQSNKRPSLTGEDPVVELERVWHERKELYTKAANATVQLDFETGNKKTDLLRKSKLVLKAVKEFLKS
jgi:shikimate kinase